MVAGPCFTVIHCMFAKPGWHGLHQCHGTMQPWSMSCFQLEIAHSAPKAEIVSLEVFAWSVLTLVTGPSGTSLNFFIWMVVLAKSAWGLEAKAKTSGLRRNASRSILSKQRPLGLSGSLPKPGHAPWGRPWQAWPLLAKLACLASTPSIS